jgi:UDP-hydrolysing UDP-N-acetyl-D-glucosamine 2-epimerase
VRTIGVVTTARSDYGIQLPVLRAIAADPELRLHLIVGGMHLAPEFGHTIDAIENDGFTIGDRIEMLLSSDTPRGVAMSMGIGTTAFAESYARLRPDILVVLGDRFEMHSAALAALPFGIPVAHIHGGEVTVGAIDDALRHSMTKLSHLHFAATERYRQRVIQLGEEPWRVTASGNPSLDNISSLKLLSREELEARFGVPFDPAPLLVTFHPVTLEFGQAERQIDQLLAALEEAGLPVVFTMPNADSGGRIISDRIRAFTADRSNAYILDNLGTQAYFSVLKIARAMVGNSSSGLLEAPSFSLPVVNVGRRQEGRVRAKNIIDVDADRASIVEGIRRAVDPAFRTSIAGTVNPYGDGGAAKRIVDVLRSVPLDERLIVKRFYDVEHPAEMAVS